MTTIPMKSIRKKWVMSSVSILASALFGFLATVIVINYALAVKQKENAVAAIKKSLIEKGEILTFNNSQAWTELVQDNAFLAVTKLVANTAHMDEDVIYGIYMGQNRQPWVHTDSANSQETVAPPGTLDDSLIVWASNQNKQTNRKVLVSGETVYEFVDPVLVGDLKAVVIRYGLTTARMNKSIELAAQASRKALINTVIVLLLVGGLALFLAYIAAGNQARKITAPIIELQAAANAIANGDFAKPVSISSDDEIGLLATNFDAMRKTVKDYTERLEERVLEKIKEIKDILDNIEQCLFTIDLQGKVNPDFALSTNSILGVKNVATHTLSELFRMNTTVTAEWMDWLEMVKDRQGVLRWGKLVRLCPIRELVISNEGEPERVVLVSYERMYNSQDHFHKLMILVQDVTEARRIEHMIREEKDRHENEMK